MTGIVLSKTRRGILTSLSVFTRKVLESSSLKVFFRLLRSILGLWVYLSSTPQVSMVYGLINHAGCWQNTRRIRKYRAADSRQES